MKKILVVVDMQNDFLIGTLANESAVNIISNIKREIESGNYDHIIFTRDTHHENYLETQEGKKLPVVHCLYNTWGWEITSELNINGDNVHFINKPTFGYNDWYNFIVHTIGDDKVELTFTGTCTDICVVSNAIAVKAELPEVNVKCIADCCAPLFGDPNRQNAALTVMESCQVEVIK